MTHTGPGTFRANLDLVFVNLAVIAGASLLAGHTYALYHNALRGHPEWTSTKITLEKGVVGAQEFAYNTQPLAGNRLNLGAWWGFQEVVSTDVVDLSEMELAFRLESDGYVHLLYDRRAQGFSGVRLSHRPDFPSIHYTASQTGEFTRVDSLALASPISAGAWHNGLLTFDSATVVIAVNDVRVGTFHREPGPQSIGFRGGQRNAWIDDVVLRFADGRSFEETFTNTRAGTPAAVMAFGILVSAGLLVALAAVRVSSVRPRHLGMGMALGYTLLIPLAGGAYVVQYVRGKDYPTVDYTMKQFEEYWVGYTRAEVLDDLRATYRAEPGDSLYRILFLGSSQTWGAGASTENQVWVRELEHLLNADGGGRRFECVNAAVSGQLAEDVLRFLRADLLAFHPQAVVVSLANNDLDANAFRDNLDEMVGLLTVEGIPAVLILEPNSIERRFTDSPHGDLAVKHEMIRMVGARHRVPVIDLHEHLAQRRDAGFVWWDFVHLTSFGHRMVAEKLRADLPRLLPL